MPKNIIPGYWEKNVMPAKAGAQKLKS